ncbi:MAG TPA: KH domain-containing protein [Holophagaceae bacterium]|nr:KH domain-containing protein [Holophagaceae bacterium]
MDLEAFLIDVLKPLLDHPDAFRVEARGEGRKREFIIHADAADMGRIIGKSGRTIQSLRTLCKVAGDNAGLHVEVEVHDEDRA